MSYLDFVDTRLGTYNSHAFSHGNCLPLTSFPWGMNAFCLQTTDNNGPWFFNPYEPIYQGIRLTHQPSPWLGDFAHFLITPVTGRLSRHSLFHRQSSYDVASALFRPDLLDITSNRYQLRTRLTPSRYGANLQLESLQEQLVSLVFYLPGRSSFAQIAPNKITFQMRNAGPDLKDSLAFYVVLRFDDNIQSIQQLVDDREIDGTAFDGDQLHIRVNCNNPHVEVAMASSYISQEQADYQLQQIGMFDESLVITQKAWENLLGRVAITTDSQDQAQLFYHCLYRTLLFPQTFHETLPDGHCYHFDITSQSIKKGKFFTNNGYWDTFRTTYPLYTILYPEYYDDFLEGILNHYKATGFLPKWLSPDERGIMPGTLVDGVIADGASKGLGAQYLSDLFEAMQLTAKQIDPSQRYGRHGADSYEELGYLPLTYNESVSHSLDYAYSDWCIGQVAQLLNHNTIAQTYGEKSLSYRQLFDTTTGYIRAKDSTGQFRDDFNPFAWGRDYAECSAIQATLGALHDQEGLIELMGGVEAFTTYLNKIIDTPALFDCQHYGYEIHEMSEMAQANLGQLAISNQPSFHIPYLFQLSHEPEKTAQLIDNIRRNAFSNDFQAFPGDEDNGSLAAWYIFSCLGFYPLCPGKPIYHFGSPAFEKTLLHLPTTSLTIVKSPYFHQQPMLDGEPIKYLTHNALINGQLLTY